MINNKKSKILIGCLALLLVLSVGYAYFSQNITINGTATAKGDFSITTTCEKGVSNKLPIEEHGTFSPWHDGGYENDSCTVSGNEVSFRSDLKYPGAARNFTIKLTNTGSIDAYLASNGGFELVKSKYCSDKSGDGVIDESECEEVEYGSSDIIAYAEPIALEKIDGTVLMFTRTADQDEIAANFYDEEGNLVLEPGESMYLVAMTGIESTVGDDGTKSIFGTLESTVKYNFTQKTN